MHMVRRWPKNRSRGTSGTEMGGDRKMRTYWIKKGSTFRGLLLLHSRADQPRISHTPQRTIVGISQYIRGLIYNACAKCRTHSDRLSAGPM